MNFVVFCYNFLPLNDAESFCSTRFCSALAEAGYKVHVVTMDHQARVTPEVYSQLIHPQLTITRIPLRKKGKYQLSRLRYLTTEWGSCNFGEAIKTLGEVLGRYKDPILISRSFPESSHIISYHVREKARKWIAHFSDPIPFMFGNTSLKGRVWKELTLRWMRKTIRTCDGISLTCDEARLYYQDTYGNLFNAKPILITQHIGNPPLRTNNVWRKPFPEKMIVHSGMLNTSRGARQITDALSELNRDGMKVRFIQVGFCDSDTKKILLNRSDALIYDSSPDLAASIVEACDVSLIPDVQVPMAYTPFMPSKFVYQLFTDKSLVLYSRPRSPMWRVAGTLPSAGLYLADYTHPQSLTSAIQRAFSSSFELQARNQLRKEFEKSVVVESFIRQLTSIL